MPNTDRPEHLQVDQTSRGFAVMPALHARAGGTVRAYEAFGASGPHVLLEVKKNDGSLGLHLPAEVARQLGEQLIALADNHYQNG